MNNKSLIWMMVAASVMATLCTRCSDNSQYLAIEKRELESGETNDSLFLGFYLGMPSKEFFNHCWKLNQKGLIREGATSMSVFYPVQGFKYPASCNFYPGFHNDEIYEMPILFTYDSWAPWNKHLHSSNLQLEVKTQMEEWFGEGFFEVVDPDDRNNKALVKIDGNRRVSIYIKDDQYVKVDIVDLPIMKLKEQDEDVPTDFE